MVENQILIVIVDDHEHKRLNLSRSLGSVRDFKVAGEATDAFSAFHKAKDVKPHVVLVDAGLPEADTIEITKKIREHLPNTGIMMMASEGCGYDIIAAITAGANSFCSKLATEDQIEMAVRTAASGGAWLDQEVAARVLQAAVAGGQSASNECKNDELKCRLTQRESEVLCLVVDGLNNQEIAEALSISAETVKTHVRHIIEKLGVHSRTEAAVLAIQEHLTAGMSAVEIKKRA
jgi:DNA-binding NarL/FixJ family response regulator